MIDISLADLGMAYRKAKVDMYYSVYTPTEKILKFEENLEQNLQALLENLQSSSEYFRSPDFLGTWTLIPKKLKKDTKQNCSEEDKADLFFSSPMKEWERKKEAGYKFTSEFRLIGDLSIEFHIISALWIAKVGHKFEEKLLPNAYGNRLRRTHPSGEEVKDNGLGEYNQFSLGSFKHYFKPFREWRDDGFAAMATALERNKDVVSITADVTSFYHRLNPVFMLNENFLKLIKVDLSEDEKYLNNLFIESLVLWAKSTRLRNGLPVGLAASSVIANAALFELDKFIVESLTPIYYGRYVDDILLVLDNSKGLVNINDVWDWICGIASFADPRSPALKRKDFKIKYSRPYLRESSIVFENAKNKMFFLDPQNGSTLIASIQQQIQERASEWRSLPDLPYKSGDIGPDLIKASQDSGEVVDNLRKADTLMFKRSSFAMKLRDFEAYERDLSPDVWQGHRREFLEAFIKHVLVPQSFFDLYTFLPRVIRLATITGEFQILGQLLDRLVALLKTLENETTLVITGSDQPIPIGKLPLEQRKLWKLSIFEQLGDAIVSSIAEDLSEESLQKRAENILEFLKTVMGQSCASAGDVLRARDQRYLADLAFIPFRQSILDRILGLKRGLSLKELVRTSSLNYEPTHLVDKKIGQGLSSLTQNGYFQPYIDKSTIRIPRPILFSTRPFTYAEMFLVTDEPFNHLQLHKFNASLLALRGYKMTKDAPIFHGQDPNVLQIVETTDSRSRGFALASWSTELSSWIAAVEKKTDPDLNRYYRLNKLINSVLKYRGEIDYLVLPELSIPAKWFLSLALKLQRAGISLIAGVEYIHALEEQSGPRKQKVVHNQVWAALRHESFEFPTLLIYRQDKLTPAIGEKANLYKHDVIMEPQMHGDSSQHPPVIRHGDFHFALLVCSELTNIEYRARLRGKVDALIIPEWNQDLNTFSALVESAALDIHTYIIQVNDRRYGDSRIRVPSKNDWNRDLIRIQGGKHDFIVIGEIDFHSLREFQSLAVSPNQPFKPTPDGFVLEQGHPRWKLPKE